MLKNRSYHSEYQKDTFSLFKLPLIIAKKGNYLMLIYLHSPYLVK